MLVQEGVVVVLRRSSSSRTSLGLIAEFAGFAMPATSECGPATASGSSSSSSVMPGTSSNAAFSSCATEQDHELFLQAFESKLKNLCSKLRLLSVTKFRYIKIFRNRSLPSPVELRLNYENTVVQARFRSILIHETPVLAYGHALV